MKKGKLFTNKQGVIALSTTMIVLFIGITLVLSLVFVFLNRIEIARNIGLSEQAYLTAESGIEDALLRFLDPAKTEAGAFPYILTVGTSSASIDKNTVVNTTTFSVVGDASNRDRSLDTQIAPVSTGSSFSYAAQIGDDGLEMHSEATVNGNVYSNGNITGTGSDTIINGDATAVGTVSSPDPTVTGITTESASSLPMPAFDEQGWKNEANINNDPINNDVTYSSGTNNLGPRKIDGNLSLDNEARLVVQGPIHVTGNLNMNSDSILELDDSFGSNGTVIVVDGDITFNSKSKVEATSANPKGYILFVSMSTSSNAIQLNSDAILEAGIYSVNGGIVINSKGDVVSIAGKGVRLNSSAQINFDLGFINYTYSPSGGSGSYDIISWEEK